MPSSGHVVAVTVLGDDRPGIVADVTGALAQLGGNLEDSTMTLLRGHFAMVVLVRTAATPDDVQRVLAPLSADGSLVVDVRELAEAAKRDQEAANMSLRVHGADKPGIVAAITRVVADNGANIVDLSTRLGRELYVLVADITLPPGARTDLNELERRLRETAASLDVEIHLSALDDDVL